MTRLNNLLNLFSPSKWTDDPDFSDTYPDDRGAGRSFGEFFVLVLFFVGLGYFINLFM